MSDRDQVFEFETPLPISSNSSEQPLATLRPARLFDALSPTLWLCLLVVTILKIVLAATTWGAADSWIWDKFARGTVEFGKLGLYYAPYKNSSYFNHPPFMANAIAAIDSLSRATSLPPRFWIRAFCALADVGSVLVIARLLKTQMPPTQARVRLLWFICAPATILLSGFHGNTDPIMMFFVLLSLLLLIEKKQLWWAGLAFGMSLNIKIVPLIFIPVLWIYLATPRRIIEYSLAALVAFFVGGFPMLLEDAPFILGRLFGYGGSYGWWGWSRLLNLAAPDSMLNFWMMTYSKFLFLALLLGVSWGINRSKDQARLWLPTQFAIVTMTFLVATPGFGNQYLAWIIPLLFAVKKGVSALIFGAASIMLLLSYSMWWRFSLPYTPQDVTMSKIALTAEIACWVSITVALFLTLRHLARRTPHWATPPSRTSSQIID